MESKRYKASVTIFLSMIMLLLIGLVMCLVEVSKVHNMKSYRRVAAEGAIESVFAEYHTNLQKEYGIFGLDAGYKQGDFSEDKMLQRFTYYGGVGDESTIESLQLMTDNQGVGFLDQVMYYMKDTTGLSFLEDMLGVSQDWESMDIEEGNKGEVGLSSLGDLKDSVTDEEENPLSDFLGFDFNGILNLVVENKNALSQNGIQLDTVASQRQLESGYGTSISMDALAATKKVALIEYTLGMFSNASVLLASNGTIEPLGDNRLWYELEYLVGGKSSDQENLKSVVHKLILLRTPVNYACLQGDSAKKLEVTVLATSIALATGAVGTESLIEESLLWAWSYGESIVDVKSLLSGHSLSLSKSSSQWQLGLSGLLNLGNSNLASSTGEGAMDYGDFLRMLLYLESLDNLTARSMDMVELGVRCKDGTEVFLLDHCISRVELNIETQVGMGYRYSFPVEFGYR